MANKLSKKTCGTIAFAGIEDPNNEAVNSKFSNLTKGARLSPNYNNNASASASVKPVLGLDIPISNDFNSVQLIKDAAKRVRLTVSYNPDSLY